MLKKYLYFTVLLNLLCIASVHAQFPCISGTTVSAVGQDATVDLCTFGSSPIVQFNNSIEALPNGFIVTDENDVILSY